MDVLKPGIMQERNLVHLVNYMGKQYSSFLKELLLFLQSPEFAYGFAEGKIVINPSLYTEAGLFYLTIQFGD